MHFTDGFITLNRVLFLCALLSGVRLGANAQTLQGRVTDAASNESLPGATLFIPGLQLGTATDARGRYTLVVGQPGTYRLVVSFVGYHSESRTVTLAAGGATLDIALQRTTLEIPAITITAKAQASDILSTPQAVAVLEGRELALQGGTAAFDVLKNVAGVRLLRTGPGIAKPVVRGLTSQRVLVIQNGIRQEGQQWADEHAPELDAFGIDRIEVVKGPASLLYGSDALGGVIQAASTDLFTYDERLTGRGTLQGLSNTRQGAANLRLGGRAGQTFYEGAFTTKRAGSYDTPEGVVPNTGLEEVNGTLRLGRSFQWGTVLTEYQHFGARLGLFEPGEEEAASDGDRFEISLPNQRVSHDRAKVHLKSAPGDGNRLEWVTTWQQNRRQEFEEEEILAASTKRTEPFEATTKEDEPALFLRLTTLTSDARFHHRPLGRLFGTIGVSGLFQRNETLAEEALIPGARIWNGGVYVFEEWMLPQLTMSGGVRFDARRLNVEANEALGLTAQRRSYTALSGALGLAWQPRSGLSLTLNAGRAWRAPVLIELFGNGVHEGTVRFERGQASLKREQNLTLESTIRWLNPHVYIEATGFVNHIDNYIFPRRSDAIDPGSGFFIYNYEQAEARLWGGEGRVDVHPHALEWLHLHLSADLTRTLNLDTDDPLPFSPASRLAFEVELERAHLGPAEEVGLRLGPTLTARQTRIDPTERPTESYTLWDASLSGTLKIGALTLSPVLAVDNLFDQAYISHLSRFRPYEILNPGRNVRFQVQVVF